jgi:type II secretory pathway pseudopilin PulG
MKNRKYRYNKIPLRRRGMCSLKLTNNYGFTLVELGLFLVIVGLLITSALKAEAVFQNAKVNKLIEEKESLSSAFYTFYDRYGTYPGDENQPSFPINDTHEGNCNGLVNENERWYLFEDLVLTRIIHGDYDKTTGGEPSNAFGGSMYILWQTINGTPSHWATFLDIPAKAAEMIDRSYDDGCYESGSVRVNTAYSNPTDKTLYWRM